jgi:hypothetical protein
MDGVLYTLYTSQSGPSISTQSSSEDDLGMEEIHGLNAPTQLAFWIDHFIAEEKMYKMSQTWG